MTRVLQVINAMYPFIGGMTQTTEDIMRSMSEAEDIEQKVICFNEDAESGGIATRRNETVHDEISGVEVIRCGSIAKIASQLISLTFGRELRNVINSFKPDIIIMHYPNPFAAHWLLPFLKRDRKIKFVLYWHLDITRQKILGKFFHGQTMRLLERADVIVSTSQNYVNGSPYLSRFKDKCKVIYNCVQDKRIALTPETERRASELQEKYSGKIISFSVGRLVPYKGYEYLIRASEYLSDDFKVLIAGGGRLEHDLHGMCEGSPKVELLGTISDHELNAYYLASDIISFPSITKNEAFGIALAEGMYFAKPAVTFTIPGSGVNFVNLNGVTGIECPNRDVHAFADALMTLKNDPELRKRLGDNARQRVIDNFLYRDFKLKIRELIDSLR